jgi:PAS domain S-box-containing protein
LDGIDNADDVAGDFALRRDAELIAARRNLEAIYQASGDGLALCRASFDEAGHVVDYQVLEVNRAHAELTGASREQMLGNLVSAIHPPVDPRWFETAEHVLRTGVMHNFDIRSRATGRWLNIRVSRVSDTLFQQTFVDVSDRRLLEEQRQALLKEMSHRVMNNFQMIAGFLHLQATDAEGAARAQLLAAERRVHVMARLHSLLTYRESDADPVEGTDETIDAGAYVSDLCRSLEGAIERPEAVRLVCAADDLRLTPEVVVPIGFIVTELVTNSIKYAYPAPAEGVIHVTVERLGEGWRLVVRDDGRGLASPDDARPGGLGWRLVQNFVRQIGATLVTTSAAGVRHEVTRSG